MNEDKVRGKELSGDEVGATHCRREGSEETSLQRYRKSQFGSMSHPVVTFSPRPHVKLFSSTVMHWDHENVMP